MRAILIDDEKPALLHLEKLLNKDGNIEVVGKYTFAQAGIDHLKKDKTDIVFLDIGMPEINGLEAAEYIQQIDQEIKIIYITAYSEYALEAFELNALDYILKPIVPVRFQKTLERIRHSIPVPQAQETQQVEDVVKVLCFKRLTLQDGQHDGKKLKWRTMKAQELFAFLLHHKGEWVSKEKIIDALWPEYTEEKATTHLHTSVYQIRKLLKEWGITTKLEYAQEGYRLNQEGIMNDVDRFEAGIQADKDYAEDCYHQNDHLLSLYRGDYLEEHDYPWASIRRQNLLHAYMNLLFTTAQYEITHHREQQAIQRLLGAWQKDPYSEEICRLLMTAYASIGHHALLASCYRGFVNLLREDLGIEPEKETVQLYQRLHQ